MDRNEATSPIAYPVECDWDVAPDEAIPLVRLIIPEPAVSDVVENPTVAPDRTISDVENIRKSENVKVSPEKLA